MGPRTEPELTTDALLGGRVRLLQPRRGYRVAIDPVLLAAAVAPGPGAWVLDAGMGSGAASLCLAARVPACRITGLERNPELRELAAANVAANGLAERIEVVAADLMALPTATRGLAFDEVMTNPPFHERHASSPPGTPTGQAAHLAEAGLGDWLAACLARLRPRGWLTLIHKADRLDRVMAALAGRAGDIAVLPLWPRAGAPARRVVVRARKGGRGPVRLLAGLVLHEADGSYTAAAEAVLRHAEPLPALSPTRELP